MIQIKETQYQDPEDRRENLDKLKASLEEFYNERGRKLFELLAKDCNNLRQANCQKYIDEIRAMYDKTFELCERNANMLLELKDECMLRVDDLIATKCSRLSEINADFEGFEPATEVIAEEVVKIEEVVRPATPVKGKLNFSIK